MTTALTVVPEDQSREVAAYTPPNPDSLINAATAQANALARIIEQKKLFTTVNGRRHVYVEGWMTLGALNQLQAFTESMRTGKDDEGNFWAAAVVSAKRVTDGIAIAQAEGFCSAKESRWRGRDEYAIRSMAQTRGTSKVFRQALAWVMTLAGYSGTPAEEIPEAAPAQQRKRKDAYRDVAFSKASDEQKLRLSQELTSAGVKPNTLAICEALGLSLLPASMTIGDILDGIRARQQPSGADAALPNPHTALGEDDIPF